MAFCALRYSCLSHQSEEIPDIIEQEWQLFRVEAEIGVFDTSDHIQKSPKSHSSVNELPDIAAEGRGHKSREIEREGDNNTWRKNTGLSSFCRFQGQVYEVAVWVNEKIYEGLNGNPLSIDLRWIDFNSHVKWTGRSRPFNTSKSVSPTHIADISNIVSPPRLQHILTLYEVLQPNRYRQWFLHQHAS